jgi:tight adherence protein B
MTEVAAHLWIAAGAASLASLAARRFGAGSRLAQLCGVSQPNDGWPTSVDAARARWRSLRAGTRRSRAIAGRRSCLVFVDALAAELSVGQPPVLALQRAGAEAGEPPLQQAARAAVLGADVAAMLRSLARRPGWDALSGVAACWSISMTSGAGLAAGLQRVAGVIRAEDDVAREVAAALSAPRATARMLAALPLVGLGMGALLGARPWHVLFATPYGLACLAVGLLLDVAGLLWVQRLARSAEPMVR